MLVRETNNQIPSTKKIATYTKVIYISLFNHKKINKIT